MSYRLGKVLSTILGVIVLAGLAVAVTIGVRYYIGEGKREADLRAQFLALKEASRNETGVSRAAALAKEGNVDAAIKMLEDQRDSEGLDSASNVLLADLYVRKGRVDDAVFLYDSVIEKEPQNVDAIKKSVELLVGADRITNACEKLKLLLAVNPNDSDTRLRLANYQYDRKEYGDASENYGKILVLKGENPVALQGLGHIALYENRAQSALGYYERAVAVNPALPESWYFIARIKYFNKDYPGSIAALRKALALGYHDPELRLKLAYALEYNGQVKDAIPEFKRFISEHPEYVDIESIRLHVSQLEFWEAPDKSESHNLAAGPDIWGNSVVPGGSGSAGGGQGGSGGGGGASPGG